MQLNVGLIDETPAEMGIISESFCDFDNGTYATETQEDGNEFLKQPPGILEGFVLEVTGDVADLEKEIEVWASALDYKPVFERISD